MGRVARVVTSFGLAWAVPGGVLTALYVAQGMTWWHGFVLGWLGWLGLVGHGVSEMAWTARAPEPAEAAYTDWSAVLDYSAPAADPGPVTSPDIFAERRAQDVGPDEDWLVGPALDRFPSGLHVVPDQRTEHDPYDYDPDQHDRDVLYADEDDRTGDSGRHRRL